MFPVRKFLSFVLVVLAIAALVIGCNVSDVDSPGESQLNEAGSPAAGGISTEGPAFYHISGTVSPDGATVQLYRNGALSEEQVTADGTFSFFVYDASSDWTLRACMYLSDTVGYYPHTETVVFSSDSYSADLALEAAPVLPDFEDTCVVYGDVDYFGDRALPGDVITVVNERGELRGLHIVQREGEYSLTAGSSAVQREGEYAVTVGNAAAEDDSLYFFINGQRTGTSPDSVVFMKGSSRRIKLLGGGGDQAWSAALHDGWNCVTVNVAPGETGFSTVFADVTDNLTIARQYTTGGVTVFDPSIPERFNTLTDVTVGFGYQLKMASEDTASATGTDIDYETQLTLHDGWNVIPYYGTIQQNSIDFFSSIKDDIIIARGYYSEGVRVYDPTIPERFNTLTSVSVPYAYQLKMENETVFDPPSGFTDAAYGDTLTGGIDFADELDYYLLTGITGETLHLYFGTTDGDLSPFVALVDGEGTPVATSSTGSLHYQMTSAGSYKFVIRDDDYTDTGDYELTLQRMNDPVGLTEVDFGQTVTGTIDDVTDMVPYGFTVEANDVVYVRFADLSTTSGTFGAWAHLYDADGTAIDDCDDGVLTAQVSQSGDVYLFISDLDSDGTGTYEFTLQRKNNPADVTATAYGETESGSIDSITQPRAYSFTGVSGDHVHVTFEDLTDVIGDFVPSMYLYTSAGGHLVNSYSGTLTHTLTYTGTYYLFISDKYRAGAGTYEFTLVKDTAPAFDGVTSASVPDSGTVDLGWSAATDDFTDPGDMVYLVYRASTSGGQSFDTADYTTSAGVTSCQVTGLEDGEIHYFVVRAQDEAGNTDTNTDELSAATPWARTYGGSGGDVIHYICQTDDGGFVTAGFTDTSGAGDDDVLVQKYNADGTIGWEKTYGGTGLEHGRGIQQTSDGGYIVGAYTESYGAGGKDFWVLKLDATGAVTWQKAYGGTGDELLSSIKEIPAGGFVAAGYTTSYGESDHDLWVVKISSTGTLMANRRLGGDETDALKFIQTADDGGFLIAAQTESAGQGNTDCWILKLTSSLTMNWHYAYGQGKLDIPMCVQETADGGVVFGGHLSLVYETEAQHPPVTEDHDFLVVKLDSGQNIEWAKSYGTDKYDKIYSLQQTADGGYVFGGKGSSHAVGSIDYWVVKTDSGGGVEWEKAFGGTWMEYVLGMQPTADGGYLVGGYTYSFGAGDMDCWLLKLAANGDCGSLDRDSTTTVTDLSSTLVRTDLSSSPGSITSGIANSVITTTSNCTVGTFSSTVNTQHGTATTADPFKTAANWEAFDASSIGSLNTTGYFGVAFDGQYIYYAPCKSSDGFHGIALRYDTTQAFDSAGSYESYDAGSTDSLASVGYAGAVYDGSRYVYFVPFADESVRHARVLRYDTQGDFDAASSWDAYDAEGTDGVTNMLGYDGAVYDGSRYVYFVPFGYDPYGHGKALRLDTQGTFSSASSWDAYDAGSTGSLTTQGYYGGAFDGRYIYYAPFHDGTEFHARALRYDTQGGFDTAGSWESYDAGSTDSLSTVGYKGAVYDGSRYIYYVPFRDADGRHGRVLRYDTTGDFDAAGSWEAYDAGYTDGLDTSGFVGAEYKDPYIYFVPYSGENNVYHGRVLRYDTGGDFDSAASWSGYDIGSTDGLDTKGYKYSASDGRYLYFSPYQSQLGLNFSGSVIRYDTSPE